MWRRFLLLEGLRISVAGCDCVSAKDVARAIKYFPSALNLPAD